MNKKVAISVLLAFILAFGFIIAIQSSSIAMAGNHNMDSSCIGHCLEQAAPYFQQDTIIASFFTLFTTVVLGFLLIQFTNSQTKEYNKNVIFESLRMLKTVMLKE